MERNSTHKKSSYLFIGNYPKADVNLIIKKILLQIIEQPSEITIFITFFPVPIIEKGLFNQLTYYWRI